MLGMVTFAVDVPVEMVGMVALSFVLDVLLRIGLLHGHERLILKTLKVMIATGG